MKPKKIKLFWAVGLTVILLASAAAALSMLWPRLLPSFYVSDLYRRYEHNDYIRATELHNFPVNDTLATDALLLEAATDSAWCELLLDFGVPEEMIEMYKSNKESFVGEGKNSIIKFYVNKNNIKERIPKKNPSSRLVLGDLAKKSLCIFLTEDNNKKEKISLFKIKELKNEHQLQKVGTHRSAGLDRYWLPIKNVKNLPVLSHFAKKSTIIYIESFLSKSLFKA